MSWTQLKNALIPKPGRLRTEALYSALVERAQFLVTGYTPVIGGVAPGSYKTVGPGTTATYTHPVITPASGTASLIIGAHTTGSGAGVITFATSSGSGTVSVPVSATAIAQYTVSGVALSGSADRCTITVQNTAGSGNVVIYGGIITATSAAGAELDELPPDSEALEAGQPVTADYVRRLGDCCIYMARKRPPALSYFASVTRGGSESYTINRDLSVGNWFHGADGKRIGDNLKISFTAPTTTYCTTYSPHSGFTSTQGGGVGTVTTHTFPAFGSSSFAFRNSGNTAHAAVESFTVYEDV